jgi:hypothetical protein
MNIFLSGLNNLDQFVFELICSGLGFQPFMQTISEFRYEYCTVAL